MLLSIDVPTESRKTGLASTLLLVVVLVVIMMMMDHGAAASKAALSLASQLRRPADHHGTSWVGTLVRPHPSRQLALRRPRRMVAASPNLLARWACPSGRQHASTAKRESCSKERERDVGGFAAQYWTSRFLQETKHPKSSDERSSQADTHRKAQRRRLFGPDSPSTAHTSGVVAPRKRPHQ